MMVREMIKIGNAGSNHPVRILVAAILVVAVSGCAIQPQPLTMEEKTALVSRDRDALFQKQEPVTRPISLPEAMARVYCSGFPGNGKFGILSQPPVENRSMENGKSI